MSDMSNTELGINPINREESFFKHPTPKNLPGLSKAQEFAGGTSRTERIKTPEEALDAVRNLMVQNEGEKPKIKTEGFPPILGMAIEGLDAIPLNRLVQGREIVAQALKMIREEYVASCKGRSTEEIESIKADYSEAVAALSDLQASFDRKPTRESSVKKDTEKKISSKESEITKDNWLQSAKLILSSDGPPFAGYGVYGQADLATEEIAHKMEVLAVRLKSSEDEVDIKEGERIMATLRLRHCAYALAGLPPIKDIQNRLKPLYINDVSKAHLLTERDFVVLHQLGIPGLEINKALHLLQKKYIDGSLTAIGITQEQKDVIRNNIIEEIYNGSEREEINRANLSLDYAINIGFATGLIAEWDRTNRRETSLSRLFNFQAYREKESDISDGGLVETKGLVGFLPPGSFYRSVRTSDSYPEIEKVDGTKVSGFFDIEGNPIESKKKYLVIPNKSKPELFDPFYYAGSDTLERAHRFASIRQTGWWYPGNGEIGVTQYYPIDFNKLDFNKLPNRSYESWIKNVRRASIVAGYLLTSYWTPSDLQSDKLAEMHGVIAELDPSKSCSIEIAIATTALMSIQKEGVRAGAWKENELAVFFRNCVMPIGQKEVGGVKESVSFMTNQELDVAIKLYFTKGGKVSFIEKMLKFVPDGRLKAILITSIKSEAQKAGGRLSITGR